MGLENNKCASCDGKGWTDEGGDGRPYDCPTCKGTGKSQKPALHVAKVAYSDFSDDPNSPRYRPIEKRGNTLIYVKEEKPAEPPVEDLPRFNLGNLNHMEHTETTLTAYSTESRTNAVYPHRGTTQGLAYAALGLSGESGEVADKIKKVLRDHGGVIDSTRREAIALELGDALWYIDAVAFECGITLEEVAQKNLKKLADRRARKVIHGEGDNR